MLAQLFRDLAPFTPALVGTFPLGLQVEGGDIDIACCGDLTAIAAALAPYVTAQIANDRLVAAFEHDGLPIEVFAQATPVHEQAGFRHMIVEGRLLAIGGVTLRLQVIAAKRAGRKTEPAFAHVLGLTGDAYAAILALEDATIEELRALVARCAESSRAAPAIEADPDRG